MMSTILRNVTKQLFQLNLNAKPVLIPTRNSNRYPQPTKKRYPIWFVKKTRVIHDDKITRENQSFIQEVVHNKYGAPAIIKGVKTYEEPLSESLLKNNIEYPKGNWGPYVKRCGAIARKIGVVPLWKNNGEKILTTMLQIVDNYVIKYTPPGEYSPTQKPRSTNVSKFGCLLVGAECMDPTMLTREYCGLFKDSGVMPTRYLGRFLVSPAAALAPGTRINVNHFRVGERIDVRGKTIDRGFQGVMKRWGFKGMPATHGVTKTHRRAGNVGSGGQKARIWPGQKMAGHMGNAYRILKGVRIVRMNTKYNVIWVHGPNVAGETNSYCYLYDTILPLKKPSEALPWPTSYEEPTEENIWADDMHDFRNATITYPQE